MPKVEVCDFRDHALSTNQLTRKMYCLVCGVVICDYCWGRGFYSTRTGFDGDEFEKCKHCKGTGYEEEDDD